MYNREYILKGPLKDVECWNFSAVKVLEGVAVTATILAGATIKVLHAYDSTQTLICVPSGLICDNGKVGYRFIVSNRLLREVINAEVPLWTEDVDLIRYESDEMDLYDEDCFLNDIGNLRYSLYGRVFRGDDGKIYC